MLDRPNATPDREFRSRIRESGAELEDGVFEDYSLLLRDAGLSSYPDEGFGRLIDWLAARARPAATRSSDVALPSILALPDSNETPAVFHDDPASFGILCTPHAVAAARPTLVFINTGANHHIGMGRMTVTMARRLAAIGFTSFRFDIGGIGDSDPPPGRSNNHPINPAAVADVRRVLDWLQGRGHSGFILIGVCSGGKLALHTTLEDKRVVGQMLLNLQGFWKPADPTNQYLSRRAYIRLALQPATWKRVFRGDTNVRGIVNSMVARAAALVSTNLQEALSRFRKQPGKRGAGLAVFRRLAARQVRTHFVYVEEDPGLDEMEMMFGRDGRMLAEIPHVSMTFERDGDHVFSSERARLRLFADVEQAAIRMGLPPVPEITIRPRSPEPESSPSAAPSL